jgi:hypothetical protein
MGHHHEVKDFARFCMLKIPCIAVVELALLVLGDHVPTKTVPKRTRPSKIQVPETPSPSSSFYP